MTAHDFYLHQRLSKVIKLNDLYFLRARMSCGASFQDFMSSGLFICSQVHYLIQIQQPSSGITLFHPICIPPPDCFSFKGHFNMVVFFQCANNKNKNLPGAWIYPLYSYSELKKTKLLLHRTATWIACHCHCYWISFYKSAISKHLYLCILW